MAIPMRFATLIKCYTSPKIFNSTNDHHYTLDASYIQRAAELSDKSACFTAPHRNFGCVIATISTSGRGSSVGGRRRVLPWRHCLRQHGAWRLPWRLHCCICFHKGTSRVVIGMRHSLQHLKRKAIQTLRNEGLQVDVLREGIRSVVI